MLSSCSSTPPILQVVIVQFGDSRKPMVSGFVERMAELGYHDNKNIQYTYLNAGRSRKQLKHLLDTMDTAAVDLIAVAGGVEADAVKKRLSGESGPPVVVLCLSNLMKRGLIDSRQNPGWSVTGVDSLNVELVGKRLEMIKELLPDAKKILVLYTPKNNSPSYQGMLAVKKLVPQFGLELSAHEVSSEKEIDAFFKSGEADDSDVLLLMPAAQLVNAFYSIILPETEKRKIPVFSPFRVFTEAGFLASYGPDYPRIGMQAADLAHKILQGTRPESIPFEATTFYEYVINVDEAEYLNIALPAQMRSKVNAFVHTSEK